MDLHNDLKELLRLLKSTGVDFLVVGAFAVAFYGRPRLTGDVDLFIRPSRNNVDLLQVALREFSSDGIHFDPNSLATAGRMLRIGREPYRVDIMTSISGVEFEEAWADRVQGNLGELTVDFISIDHLLQNKRSTGRLKDVADVDELTRDSE